MIKILTIILIFFLSTHIRAQKLEEVGIKILTNESLSDSELKQIQDYNFKNYRKDYESVVVQILNGPTLELLPRNAKTKGIISENNNELSDHISPSERKISTIKVIQINLFNTQENVAK